MQSDDKYSSQQIVPYAQGGYKQIKVFTREIVLDAGTGLNVQAFTLDKGLWLINPVGQICWYKLSLDATDYAWINNPAAGVHQGTPVQPGPGGEIFIDQAQFLIVYQPTPIGTVTFTLRAKPGDES